MATWSPQDHEEESWLRWERELGQGRENGEDPTCTQRVHTPCCPQEGGKLAQPQRRGSSLRNSAPRQHSLGSGMGADRMIL